MLLKIVAGVLLLAVVVWFVYELVTVPVVDEESDL